jgi:glycosyltransferase involved in cell wall biosynthesis
MPVDDKRGDQPLRVHVLFESDDAMTPHGSSYIRLLRPLGHPSVAGSVVVTQEDVDVVIIERLWRGDLTPHRQSRLLMALARRAVPYVYSLDDNLLDLNLEAGRPQSPSPSQRNLVREFIRSAAGVIVSTEPLAERIASLNRHVVVVPNQIDETLYAEPVPRDRTGDGVVIGYMGTYSHLEDLMMIAQPLRRLLGRHRGQVRLELVGVASRAELLAMFPGGQVRVLQVPGSAVRYPEFVQWMQKTIRWDFALAPLEINGFTRSKSDIKMLDYGILGIPGLFSRAPAYEHTVQHEVTGLLVKNHVGDWAAALERMVDAPALRTELAASVRQHVRASRTLSGHAFEWVDALRTIVSAAAAERSPMPPPLWGDR